MKVNSLPLARTGRSLEKLREAHQWATSHPKCVAFFIAQTERQAESAVRLCRKHGIPWTRRPGAACVTVASILQAQLLMRGRVGKVFFDPGVTLDGEARFLEEIEWFVQSSRGSAAATEMPCPET